MDSIAVWQGLLVSPRPEISYRIRTPGISELATVWEMVGNWRMTATTAPHLLQTVAAAVTATATAAGGGGPAACFP